MRTSWHKAEESLAYHGLLLMLASFLALNGQHTSDSLQAGVTVDLLL